LGREWKFKEVLTDKFEANQRFASWNSGQSARSPKFIGIRADLFRRNLLETKPESGRFGADRVVPLPGIDKEGIGDHGMLVVAGFCHPSHVLVTFGALVIA